MSRGAEVCAHMNFAANVVVNRIEDKGRFCADIGIRCADCGVRFAFIGPPMGLSPTEPMVSVGRLELRAPIEPDAHATSMLAGL